MKILNLYYGIDDFNFDAEPHHSAVRYDVSEEDILVYREKAKQALQNKKCFWWLLHVLEVSPKTGATSSVTFFDSVKEKEKIIINAKARQNKSPATQTTTMELNQAAFGDLMGGLTTPNPWPAPWVLKINPAPEPVPDAPIPF